METSQQGIGQKARSPRLCLDHRSEIQAPDPFAGWEVPLETGGSMSWLDDDSEDSGPGLGTGMLLGGALTWLFGGGRTEYVLPDYEEYEDLGVLTKEERGFLSQLWRLEFQIEEALKKEEWEQALMGEVFGREK